MEMTVLELLLKSLPDGYVDCVLNNLEDRSVLKEDASYIQEEIMILFNWNDSREGYDFWSQVYMYVSGEDVELPPLPIDIKYKPSTVLVASNSYFMMNAASTGLNIKYDIDLKNLKKAEEKIKEEVLSWYN
jgi:ABC-type amino acid transport substrate-binding protein